MYSQHNSLVFVRDKNILLHKHSNQLDISRKARVVLCAYCCMGNQHDTNQDGV